MTGLYQALAGIALILAAGIGGYFYGDHVGATAGKAALAETVSKLDSAALAAQGAAINQQRAQDAALLKASQNATQAAQASAAIASQSLASAQFKLRGYENVPHDKAWLDSAVPVDIRGVLNGSTGGGAGANGHPQPVRARTAAPTGSVPTHRHPGNTDQR